MSCNWMGVRWADLVEDGWGTEAGQGVAVDVPTPRETDQASWTAALLLEALPNTLPRIFIASTRRVRCGGVVVAVARHRARLPASLTMKKARGVLAGPSRLRSRC